MKELPILIGAEATEYMPSELDLEKIMKCPIDGEVLMVAERSGVEIDYCPKCRGVWLDRGELEKIIDRSSGASMQMDRNAGYGAHAPKKKRKESILGELFDF